MACTNLAEPLKIYISPDQMGDGAYPWPPTHPVRLRIKAAMIFAETYTELVCPQEHTAFRQEHRIMIQRHTTSVKEWANVWSPDKMPRSISISIVKLGDGMMKHTLMYPKRKREWGLGQSSTAIFPEWWATMCPNMTGRQQYHLCNWCYSHRSVTGLESVHEPSPP